MSDPSMKKKKKRRRAREDSGQGRVKSSRLWLRPRKVFSCSGEGQWFGQDVGHDPKDRTLTDMSGRSSSSPHLRRGQEEEKDKEQEGGEAQDLEGRRTL